MVQRLARPLGPALDCGLAWPIQCRIVSKVKRARYELEQLYEHQDPDFVIETVAHVLHWLDPKNEQHSHRFEIRENKKGGVTDHELILSWDIRKLAEHDPRLLTDLDRFRAGKTLTGEDQTKYAAYGLALVAISYLLQRRVVRINYFRAPDLLFNYDPDALRGVEVAGRSSKGHAAFMQALEGASGKPGKRAQLRACVDVEEAYISLWCIQPKVSIWEKVKP